MWKSLAEYFRALGYWGFLVTIPMGLDALGIYQLASGQATGIPSWLLFVIALTVTLLIPFIAFHKVRVERDSLQLSLENSRKTPKLPHPELFITYHKHQFHTAGEGEYTTLNVAKGTPIVSIEAEFRPTGAMHVETVELNVAGKRIPSLNWKVQESSERLWFSPSNVFDLSGISVGKHEVELLVFANKEWWRSYPFSIEVNFS